MEQLLPIPLALATDCAELTADTTMGILSTQGRSSSDRGRAAPLLLDQQPGARADRAVDLSLAVPGAAAGSGRHAGSARARDARVPARRGDAAAQAEPLASLAYAARVGAQHPQPDRDDDVSHGGRASANRHRTSFPARPALANYDEWNSRAILADWTDHPQRLWDALENTLASGAELVIHVGPEPKLLTTCFDRLSHRIMKQLKMRHLDRLGSQRDPEHQPQRLADPQASRRTRCCCGLRS